MDPHTLARLAELDAELATERAIREAARFKSHDWWCATRRIRALESVRAVLQAGEADAALLRHGHARQGAKTPEYEAWSSMIKRCDPANASRDRYRYHAGRGIRVCERWRSFGLFLADVGPRPSPLHSLDRIDNDGHYEPGNVRWATHQEQMRNKRSNRFIECDGERLTIAEWVERTGLTRGTIERRLKLGWPADRILSKVTQQRAPLEAGANVRGWTVVARVHVNGKAKWLCRCSCGAECSRYMHNLQAGHVSPCECRKVA